MSYITNNVIKFRKKQGMTQIQLSELSGVPIANLQRYERGEVEPRMNHIIDIAKVLGVRLENLVEKPSMVITVANSKGGTGKTTFVTHLSKYIKQANNKSVCILDSDIQQSIASVYTENSIVDVEVFKHEKQINKTLEYQDTISELKNQYDIIIIDTVGSSEDLSFIQTAVNNSDILLIPFQITRTSILEMGIMTHVIEHANIKKEKAKLDRIKSFAIANMVTKNTLESKSLKQLDFGEDIHICKNMIHHSVDYQRTDDLETILSKPHDGHEFDILMKELNKKINLF